MSIAAMPDSVRKIVEDDQAIDAVKLPSGSTWTREAFKQVYNDYYAFPDSIITDLNADLDKAPSADHAGEYYDNRKIVGRLHPLLRTMEVIGDDEVDLSYDEWVYAQTGRWPRSHGIEVLSQKMSRANFSSVGMLPGLNQPAGLLEQTLTVGTMRNHACTEAAILLTVAGFWEQPNVYKSYEAGTQSLAGKSGHAEARRAELGNIDNFALRQGTEDDPFFVVDFFNSLDWFIPRPIGANEADALSTTLGDVGAVNALNFYLHGQQDNDGDWDPSVVKLSRLNVIKASEAVAQAAGLPAAVTAQVGNYLAYKSTKEATEGAESFRTQVRAFGKASILTDLGNF